MTAIANRITPSVQSVDTIASNDSIMVDANGLENFISPSGKTTADIRYGLLGNEWIAEYAFRIRMGKFQGSSVPLSTFSMPYRTKREAIADAADRLLVDVHAQCGRIADLPTAQQREVRQLIGWANELINRPDEPETTLPLAGKTFVDLFAGIGGFHEALKQQGAKCVAAVELDAAARQVYLDNHGHDLMMFEDITKVNTDDLPDFDILTGGFPCQSFSVAGKHLGFDDPEKGGLFFQILRIAKARKPAQLILENVEGFATHDNGDTADRAIDELTRIGYAVSMQVMTASEFGVPQQRKRIFIIGTRLDRFHEMGYPHVFPAGETPTKVVADILEPNITEGRSKIPMIPEKTAKPDPRGIIQEGKLNGKRFQTYRVMSPDGQGGTLTRKHPGVYLVDGHPRYPTPRECARMQGFPEGFKLHPVATVARQQFGNAVAVPVVSALSNVARHFIG